MAEKTTAVTTAKISPSDKAISTIRQQLQAGLTLPETYNFVNAIKSSILILADTKDREGRSVLETCTPTSIQTALVDMAQKGLDVSKGQGYFAKYGNTLKFMKEYHGVTTEIQRLFPNYTPDPRVIYQGDVIEYGIDPNTGRRFLVKHEQKFENLDNEVIGAYMYIPRRDGGQELYVMTIKEIKQAWMKSGNKDLTTHKQFPQKMVCKTIINSALSPLVKSSDSVKGSIIFNPEDEQEQEQPEEVIDFDGAEVVDVDAVEVETPQE